MLLRALLATIAAARGALGGALWPQPQAVVFSASSYTIDARFFTFNVSGSANPASAVLQDALLRYAALAFVRVPPTAPLNASLFPPAGALVSLAIIVQSADETLALATSENYTLAIGGGAATLAADTVYGAVRGLETFSQLVDFVSAPAAFEVPAVAVADAPRFAHRGALVDTSRHFLPLPALLAYLDAMAYTKLNVLHWHLVDDQSFPYFSPAFPSLSGAGAWDAQHVYGREDVKAVVAYAKARGIRVIPEFDTPGHTQSWGSIPGLLTQCYSNASGTPTPVPGVFGPIDPTSDAAWTFLTAFFAEVAATFPDSYIHVGGDEVSYDCWESNPNVAAWMAATGIATYAGLESYYVQRLINLVAAQGRSVVGWQEIFDNNLTLPSETVVCAWKGGAASGPAEMGRITSGGFRALLSAGWYENYIAYGAQWPSYYALDPSNFTGPGNAALVMGGELACWGEYVDSTNVISRVFPYGCAIAERLWSAESVRDVADAAPRLHAHRCRMISRGLTPEPANGPSFCPQEYIPTYAPPWA